MSDSFVVQIPPGATEIDLRPLLAPIVRAIMKNEKDRFDHYAEEHVEQFFDRFKTESKLIHLLEKIKWEWLRDYMLAKGWRRSPGSENAQYYPPEEKNYGQSGVCIVMKEKWIPQKTLTTNYNLIEQTWRAVRDIARFEKNSRSPSYGDMFTTASSVMEHTDVVTRLGMVSDAD
jgi:hypothetical protein